MAANEKRVRSGQSRITEEHLKIRALLARLRSMDDPQVMLPLLEELRGTLLLHFELEESDEGVQAIISRHAPRHMGRARDLMDEHPVVLTEITGLIEECNACIAGPLAAIQANLHRLIQRIHHHDVVESEILTDARIESGEERD